MKPGLFFKLENNSSPGSLVPLFSYLCVKQGESYPIYCLLKEEYLAFYFHSSKGKENINLLTLTYSDYKNNKGKLFRKIEQLIIKPQRKLIFSDEDLSLNSNYKDIPSYASAYNELVDETPKNGNCTQLGHLEEKTDKPLKICLATLLLDFLYDSKQSEVFSLSPHFEKWLTVIRENEVLKAIHLKVDFLHRRILHRSLKTRTIQYKFAEKSLQKAENKWLEQILSPVGGPTISNSRWFHKSLEQEIKHVLKDNSRISLNNPHSLGKETVSDIVEWLIYRLNYRYAWKVLKRSHPRNRNLIIGICSLPLLYIIIQALYRNHTSVGEIILVVLTLILSSLALGGLISQMTGKSQPPDSESSIQAYNSILFLSPQLLIAIIGSWWGVPKVIQAEVLSSAQIFWIYALDAVLVPTFLFKIIKDEAPDLNTWEVIIRIFHLVLRVTCFIGVIGLLILDFQNYSTHSPRPIPCCQIFYIKFWICWDYLWKQFPMVFLSSVFVGAIFRGKIFTGWYPRSLGK